MCTNQIKTKYRVRAWKRRGGSQRPQKWCHPQKLHLRRSEQGEETRWKWKGPKLTFHKPEVDFLKKWCYPEQEGGADAMEVEESQELINFSALPSVVSCQLSKRDSKYQSLRAMTGWMLGRRRGARGLESWQLTTEGSAEKLTNSWLSSTSIASAPPSC